MEPTLKKRKYEKEEEETKEIKEKILELELIEKIPPYIFEYLIFHLNISDVKALCDSSPIIRKKCNVKIFWAILMGDLSEGQNLLINYHKESAPDPRQSDITVFTDFEESSEQINVLHNYDLLNIYKENEDISNLIKMYKESIKIAFPYVYEYSFFEVKFIINQNIFENPIRYNVYRFSIPKVSSEIFINNQKSSKLFEKVFNPEPILINPDYFTEIERSWLRSGSTAGYEKFLFIPPINKLDKFVEAKIFIEYPFKLYNGMSIKMDLSAIKYGLLEWTDKETTYAQFWEAFEFVKLFSKKNISIFSGITRDYYVSTTDQTIPIYIYNENDEELIKDKESNNIGKHIKFGDSPILKLNMRFFRFNSRKYKKIADFYKEDLPDFNMPILGILHGITINDKLIDKESTFKNFNNRYKYYFGFNNASSSLQKYRDKKTLINFCNSIIKEKNPRPFW
jgi:hypothetical protein